MTWYSLINRYRIICGSRNPCRSIQTKVHMKQIHMYIYIYIFLNPCFLGFLHYLLTLNYRLCKSTVNILLFQTVVFHCSLELTTVASGRNGKSWFSLFQFFLSTASFCRLEHNNNCAQKASCQTVPTMVSSLREGLHWKWLWAGKEGSRRWGWEAGSGLRSGITSSHWSCQVYSTQRCHTCSRHRVRRRLIQWNDCNGFDSNRND